MYKNICFSNVKTNTLTFFRVHIILCSKFHSIFYIFSRELHALQKASQRLMNKIRNNSSEGVVPSTKKVQWNLHVGDAQYYVFHYLCGVRYRARALNGNEALGSTHSPRLSGSEYWVWTNWSCKQLPIFKSWTWSCWVINIGDHQ